MHEFEQGANFGANVTDERHQAMMREAVGGVDVEVRAEAGAVKLPVADVLALRPGDTVRLRTPVASGVTLHVGDVATFSGRPGRNGNQRAVQVGRKVEGKRR
jgi:flagellar motor switch protein FliM